MKKEVRSLQDAKLKKKARETLLATHKKQGNTIQDLETGFKTEPNRKFSGEGTRQPITSKSGMY